MTGDLIDNEGTRSGLFFGLTSGVITTLGLVVGLNSGTHSSLAVIGGIIVIAIADGASDALGIHISKESEASSTSRTIWLATFATFISKFLVALSFLVPMLLLELKLAIIVAIAWGLAIIIMLSYFLARTANENPYPIIAEHVVIAIAVIALSHYVGSWVNSVFA